MVFIERRKELSKIKRHKCCKRIPKDDEKNEITIRQPKERIPEELVRDVRGTRDREEEKLLRVKLRLDVKRREAEVKRTSLVNQWNKLKKNEEDFRCVFVEFHQFTLNNRERVERESTKIDQLRRKRAETNLELKEINGKILVLGDTIEQMKRQFDKHAFYDKFLEEYAISTKAKSVHDVLFRYELLLETREEMERYTERRQHSIQQYRKYYDTILESWNDEILKYSETLTQQSSKYEEAKRQVNYWERTVYDIQRHAHSIWLDIELMREALDHIVCLLLIRMKAKAAPGLFKKDKTFYHLLTTTEGKILYLNKMLGDLNRVKNEVLEIFKEEQRAVNINAATSTKPRHKKRDKSKKSKNLGIQEYPVLSPGTSRILDMLENNIKRTAEKTQTRGSEVTPQMSYNTTSTLDSGESRHPRGRAMTSWLISKEARRKGKKSSTISEPITEIRANLLSDFSSRYSLPWSKSSEFISSGYSCVALTTDASSSLLSEKRSKEQNRIIERNFSRYEKFLHNKMDTDSSLIKVNKDTGKLELPELKFKQKHPVEKASGGVILPKLDHSAQRRSKKIGMEDVSIKTYTSQQTSMRSSTKSKKGNLLFEDIKKFLDRPTITQQFTFGNLL